MPDGPIIRLWEHDGTGLIIACPSGVRYSNQTGGHACYHPEIEGAFVPIGNEGLHSVNSAEDDLFAYFAGPAHGGWGTGPLRPEDADAIDTILRKYPPFDGITVDRSKLDDSHEAWVYVLIQPASPEQFTSIVAGFAPYPRSAVLTWANSD